jgi:UDP-N-acetylglucosamine 2-epimerase (non-hydrolysing)
LWDRAHALPQLLLIDPLPYLEFVNLMANARFVLTDSGGIQEETTVLGIPCLTLRSNTERPITVTRGTNQVIGNDPDRIVSECRLVLAEEVRSSDLPEHWDGRTAIRIVEVLVTSTEAQRVHST